MAVLGTQPSNVGRRFGECYHWEGPWAYMDCPARRAVDVWDDALWIVWQTAMMTVQDVTNLAICEERRSHWITISHLRGQTHAGQVQSFRIISSYRFGCMVLRFPSCVDVPNAEF